MKCLDIDALIQELQCIRKWQGNRPVSVLGDGFNPGETYIRYDYQAA